MVGPVPGRLQRLTGQARFSGRGLAQRAENMVTSPQPMTVFPPHLTFKSRIEHRYSTFIQRNLSIDRRSDSRHDLRMLICGRTTARASALAPQDGIGCNCVSFTVLWLVCGPLEYQKEYQGMWTRAREGRWHPSHVVVVVAILAYGAPGVVRPGWRRRRKKPETDMEKPPIVATSPEAMGERASSKATMRMPSVSFPRPFGNRGRKVRH